jgi:hypothetical protein
MKIIHLIGSRTRDLPAPRATPTPQYRFRVGGTVRSMAPLCSTDCTTITRESRSKTGAVVLEQVFQAYHCSYDN